MILLIFAPAGGISAPLSFCIEDIWFQLQLYLYFFFFQVFFDFFLFLFYVFFRFYFFRAYRAYRAYGRGKPLQPSHHTNQPGQKGIAPADWCLSRLTPSRRACALISRGRRALPRLINTCLPGSSRTSPAYRTPHVNGRMLGAHSQSAHTSQNPYRMFALARAPRRCSLASAICSCLS